MGFRMQGWGFRVQDGYPHGLPPLDEGREENGGKHDPRSVVAAETRFQFQVRIQFPGAVGDERCARQECWGAGGGEGQFVERGVERGADLSRR